MNKILIVAAFAIVILHSCESGSNTTQQATTDGSVNNESLTLEQAELLATLPLKCLHQEYPNKLGDVLANASKLKAPQELHPSFYGCFDWHSAVHGHWSLVVLLKKFPKINQRDTIIAYLEESFDPERIIKEVAYFEGNNKNFERTYGWAWVLKLAEELYTWNHPMSQKWFKALEPLTQLMVYKYKEFLPKLVYPIRTGEHPNTAFGLVFAYDYACTLGDTSLANLIFNRAKDFYLKDVHCPITWEPGGYDFLSPCLEEAHLMAKVLDKESFHKWITGFMPFLLDPDYKLNPGIVSDRLDGKLVHLDGLNFSRAWCLFTIAGKLEGYDHLNIMAFDHIHHSLPHLVGDSYEGGHWLGSFAIYALQSWDLHHNK